MQIEPVVQHVVLGAMHPNSGGARPAGALIVSAESYAQPEGFDSRELISVRPATFRVRRAARQPMVDLDFRDDLPNFAWSNSSTAARRITVS